MLNLGQGSAVTNRWAAAPAPGGLLGGDSGSCAGKKANPVPNRAGYGGSYKTAHGIPSIKTASRRMSHGALPRYAVYYAPPRDGGLWPLAQSWLGRDCETGEDLAQPGLQGWTAAEIAALTASPRHYGFHATLKAPFHLAPGVSLRHLHESLAAFAARRRAFLLPPLEVTAIGAFLALTLSAPAPEMESLAVAAVRELDLLRAPLDESNIARRRAGDLTPRQEQFLRTWGYPYVLEEFRFHMTLTGPIQDADLRQRLQTRLAALFGPQLAKPVPVREICLYSQATRDQPFALVERFGFGAVTTEAEPKVKAGQAQ